MCKDSGQNMFNLALSAKNSGEVWLIYKSLKKFCMIKNNHIRLSLNINDALNLENTLILSNSAVIKH